MIHRILRKRRQVPALAAITTEEELALLRVELMYGLRVNREAYLRRKADECAEVATRLSRADTVEMLAGLRGSLERAVPRRRVESVRAYVERQTVEQGARRLTGSWPTAVTGGPEDSGPV
ncbi:hypothetical protein [Nonomuraea longicatena]|uniref:Uncharacterized protein n=1 Tax=Nonomuraea longicatena TaxID=83682 RepID=A0ABN1QFL5_9ACTN